MIEARHKLAVQLAEKIWLECVKICTGEGCDVVHGHGLELDEEKLAVIIADAFARDFTTICEALKTTLKDHKMDIELGTCSCGLQPPRYVNWIEHIFLSLPSDMVSGKCLTCGHSLLKDHDDTGCHWRQQGKVRECSCVVKGLGTIPVEVPEPPSNLKEAAQELFEALRDVMNEVEGQPEKISNPTWAKSQRALEGWLKATGEVTSHAEKKTDS